MSWFKRDKKNITTPTEGKKDSPQGLWYKTPSGNIIDTDQLKANNYVSPEDGYHVRINSPEYFEILFDDGEFIELDEHMISKDPLEFTDSKKYTDRISAAQKKTGLKDALRSGVGYVNNVKMVISCFDFNFIGGSMGSVVGEKIVRAADHCLKNDLPFMIICKSGGARMMEAAFSLMQLAKISAKLNQLADKKIPYLAFSTDPTTGGVTASFAMVGDLNIAEPGALIGFAGPRIVKETIGKELPEGFQTSEFLLEHGFLDKIIHRKELKKEISHLLTMLLEDRVQNKK